MTFVKTSHLNHPSATCILDLSTAFPLLHRASTCCVYYPETARRGSPSFGRGRTTRACPPAFLPSTLGGSSRASHLHPRCSAALRLCLASPSGHCRLENACGPGKTTPKSPPSRSALCRVLRTVTRPSQSPLLCTRYLLLSL